MFQIFSSSLLGINGSTSLTIKGITFHLYGLIIGLSIWLGFWLANKKAKQAGIPDSDFWSAVYAMLVGGILGARFWYVVTNWYLYQNQWLAVLKIWQGGTSVIGAVVGGLIGAWLVSRKGRIRFKKLLDLVAFSLPFAQALGRWANYVNQELYGLPTNLPWGIKIDLEHRLADYRMFETYHPLFLYEMVLMLGFGLLVWWLDGFGLKNESKIRKVFGKRVTWKIGDGNYFVFYIFYYSLIRFLLDFIRLDKMHFLNTIFSKNQVFLGLVLGGILLYKLIKTNFKCDNKS